MAASVVMCHLWRLISDKYDCGVYVSCLPLPRYISQQYAPVCAYSDCRRPTWGKCGGGRHLNIGWSETCGNDTNVFPSYQFRTFRYVERYYAYVLLCFVVFSCPAPSLRQRKIILLRRGCGGLRCPSSPIRLAVRVPGTHILLSVRHTNRTANDIRCRRSVNGNKRVGIRCIRYTVFKRGVIPCGKKAPVLHSCAYLANRHLSGQTDR